MTGDRRELEHSVQDELKLVEGSHFAEEMLEPIANWQFDPTDVQRYEVGLHSLLDAVETRDAGPPRDPFAL
ncbi:hypothetical protein JNUCC0626_07440 [Lentzea sp. JNUCC 0626]|uniref:hypothetical protein n=1 Tax=Lentzea sp. JNUCC 0626 TaxID=3367513 RepID=UPI003748DF12